MSVNKAQTFKHPTVYANFGERIGMFVLDAIIIAILSMFVRYLFQYFVGSYYNYHAYESNPLNLYTRVINYPFIYIAVGFAYFVVLEQSSLKGSIGKWFLGYRVYSDIGSELKFWQSLLRNIFKCIILFAPLLLEFYDDDLLPYPYALFLIVALLTMSNYSKKQCLNDLGACTFVAK